MPPDLGVCSVAGHSEVARATPGAGDRRAALETARASAQKLINDLGVPVHTDAAGWDVPTAAGLIAESAVRRVGALVAAQAEAEAAERITVARGALAPNHGAFLAAAGPDERARAARGVDRWSAVRGRILANAYRDVLSHVRPMGPGRDGVGTLRSTPALDRLLTKAAGHYPREWVVRSNAARGDANGLYVTHHPDRASYDADSVVTRTLPGGQRIDFPADVLYLRYVARGWRRPGYAVACHEFAHRCEHLVPEIGALSRVFVARRAIDPATGRRQPLLSYPQPDRTGPDHAEQVDFTGSEWVQPSGLIDVYMGKIYRNRRYHEVLSTGVESLFAGAYGGLVGAGEYRPDNEHRDFTLGLLATV